MPFDALALAAVTDEIAATAVGGRIQKILQPSAASVALSLYNQGTRAWLLLSADAQTPRVYLASGRLAKGFDTPSSSIVTP